MKNFAYSMTALKTIAEETLKRARARGAEEATVSASEHIGLSVNVRHGIAEQSEYAHDKQLSISVRCANQMGTASTSDLHPSSIDMALSAALDFARYTSPDPFAQLPDADWLATTIRPLDIFHPWSLDMQSATALAKDCEARTLAQDARLTNSEGCALSTGMGQSVLAHSHGFLQGIESSHHSIGCAVIAENAQGMQRDGWFEDSREPLGVAAINRVVEKTVGRTLRRLSPRRAPTTKAPVIFDETCAPSLIHALVRAVSGGALYRRASFMLDSLGKKVLPDFISIDEDPFIAKAIASKPFDDEGVAVSARSWITRGVLNGYFLSSYSARKLGMKSTGHAGGAHNLRVIDHLHPQLSLTQMIGNLRQGLWVTELMGQGVNSVTGDYSRGAVGFWIENGQIAYPVEELTIAGNVKQMLLGIGAVSHPPLIRGGMECGAILIDEMTIAGE